MRTIKKRELLKAMNQILSEYKNTSHTTRLNECGLCKLYHIEDMPVNILHECTVCPMTIFEGRLHFPCRNRKCMPIDCSSEITYLGTKKLPAVIEFYVEAIEVVKTMTSRQMNKKNAFKFLIDIDNKVAKKYKLCK